MVVRQALRSTSRDDHALDLAVIGSLTTPGVERPGVLVVFLGVGDETFGPPSTIATNLVKPISLVATRLDTAGGNADIVLIERGDPFSQPAKPGSTRVYAGNGDGTFVTPPIVLDNVAHPDALAVADLNGDGLRDVLVPLGPRSQATGAPASAPGVGAAASAAGSVRDRPPEEGILAPSRSPG